MKGLGDALHCNATDMLLLASSSGTLALGVDS